MKKLLLLFCMALALSNFGFSQEVPEIQKSLLTKITATWCSNCGGWGWDFFEDIIVDNSGNKAVFVGAHHSGDLLSSSGAAFSVNFMAPYQPYFYVGNQEMGVTSGNASTKRQEIQDLVNSNFLESPVANVGFDADISDNFLTVDAKAKFFQEATGDYYMGVYIVEDGVINEQTNNSPNAVHPFVIRESMVSDDFGIALENGTIAADTEYTESFSIQLNPNWNAENLIVMGIIWKKEGSTYQFVNVNSTTDFETPNAVDFISEDVLKVELFPTIANESTQLNLNLKDQSLNVSIQVFNQNGQIAQQVFSGNLNEGIRTLGINTNDLASGIYFVTIRAQDGRILTKKLIVL